eukprot:11166242-Lingulodinium_polyedra.AAC.1
MGPFARGARSWAFTSLTPRMPCFITGAFIGAHVVVGTSALLAAGLARVSCCSRASRSPGLAAL